MRNRILIVALVSVLLAGCASVPPSDGSAPVASPFVSSPAFETTVTVGRAIARVGLTVELNKRKVPAPVISNIVAELKAVVDGVIAGRNLAEIVLDPVLWTAARADAQPRLALVILTFAKVDGVGIIDSATADLYAGQLIDTFYQIVKSAARSHK
jgi:hypothetical protein